MILIIDNYDSFTYNLYQALALITDEVKVYRNDAITIDEIKRLNPDSIILSPGPGRPETAGICIDVIKQLGSITPILGVCLGHQAIGIAFGAVVGRAPEPLHGKDSLIFHNQSMLFNEVDLPFRAGRYHSLIVEEKNLPADLIIDARDEKGSIMALSHRNYPIYGVQFHPESILTPQGVQILKNFITMRD
ncbi:MAG: anthranilate synthase component [Pseudomonadota bacterium]|nr:anthranilate synthase component [Pseudomonadota bacterium]